jgi:hypothetical protein
LVALLAGLVPACSEEDKACTTSSLTLEGELALFFGEVPFDAVAASLTHRRDADAEEDGIVTRAAFTFTIDGGCKLELVAEGCPDPMDRLSIRSLRLEADPHCPGLSSGQEGTYLSSGTSFLGHLELGLAHVPDRDAATSCFAASMTLHLAGEVLSKDTALPRTIPASSAVVKGTFLSTGDYAARIDCGTVIGPGDTHEEADSQLADVTTGEPDLPAGPPCIAALNVSCPKCESVAAVRVIAATGWAIGQPEFIHVFDSPVFFPLKAQISEAMTPEGKTVALPAGTVTFQAYQDTVAGGMAPEEGEPVSKLYTADLAAGQITQVPLVLDVDSGPIVSCTPGEDACLALKMSGHCNEAGDAWNKTDCEDGYACNETSGKCQSVLCSPSSSGCADGTHTQECLPSGTGYTAPIPCDGGYVCAGGKCMAEECLAEVLFLVDTSSSMYSHWEAVGTSILKMAAMSPTASFGMINFPKYGNSGCDIPSGAVVPLAAGQSAGLSAWFEENNAFGLTPLVATMQAMPALLPGLFTSGKGTLILLSDGADTCAYASMTDLEEREKLVIADLEAAAADLLAKSGIKTFVIGYQYEGNTAELDAIAKNGGTGKDTYTEAGNEQELFSALVGIAKDLKLCFE